MHVVYAHFGDYRLRILHFNAVDVREVHARDAVQLSAKVKTRLMPASVLASSGCAMGSLSRSILGSILLSCPSMRSTHV